MNLAPLAGEGGEFNIRAYFPDNEGEDVGYEDSFTILGAKLDTIEASHDIIADTPFTASVQLENLTGTTLTDFTYDISSLPNNWDVQVDLPSDLAGNGTNTVSYTITAPNNSTITQDTFNINLTSAEGVTATLPVEVDLERIIPRLVADTSTINSGMLRGEQTFVEIELTNEGGAVANDIQVLLPNVPWLSLATADSIESLAPGESTNVTLALMPDSDLELTEYTGNIVFDGAGNDGDLSVGFNFRAVSEATGDLTVNVLNELFYFAEGSPKLEDATVIIRDYFTQEEIARVTTDETGMVNFEDLAEGYYTLEVKAEDHDTFGQTVQTVSGEASAGIFGSLTLTVSAAEGLLANDTDVDGDDLTVSLLTDVSNGSLTLNPDGSFEYKPDDGFNGSDSFTYTVDDGNGGIDNATVSIDVGGVNDDPVAVDDAYETDEDETLSVGVLNGLLANDTDVDGDDLTVSLLTDVSNGSLTLNPDGSFEYKPDGDFNGSDSFTYTVSDGNGGTDTGNVPLTVNPGILEPEIEFGASQYSVDEGVGNSMSVTLIRSGDLSSASEVLVSITGGSATPVNDYDASTLPLTVTFAANEDTQIVTIPIIDDNEVESTETINLGLTTVSNAEIGDQDSTVFKIFNNDLPEVSVPPTEGNDNIEGTDEIDNIQGNLGRDAINWC